MTKRYGVNAFGIKRYGDHPLYGWRVLDNHPTERSPFTDSRVLAVYRFWWQAWIVTSILNHNPRGKIGD